MTYQLKMLSPDALPGALEKAHLYRLLNEPAEAESICRDVLDVEPDNQDALITLLLALTDQFDAEPPAALSDARNVAERLANPYTHAYYTGVAYERRAKAQLRQNVPGAGPQAYEWLREAMSRFEKAEMIRPAGNDDALLRWNACARLLMRANLAEPPVETREEPLLLE
jgi:hypothetical protein